MPRSRLITKHTIMITQDISTHEWQVERDRRVLIGYLTYEEAVSYVERVRMPDEQVWTRNVHNEEREITSDLRRRRLTR